jgi:hypothetical protein
VTTPRRDHRLPSFRSLSAWVTGGDNRERSRHPNLGRRTKGIGHLLGWRNRSPLENGCELEWLADTGCTDAGHSDCPEGAEALPTRHCGRTQQCPLILLGRALSCRAPPAASNGVPSA